MTFPIGVPEIPRRLVAKPEALTGPMTPCDKRVQTVNPPWSEVGPSTVVTGGKAVIEEVLQKFISNKRGIGPGGI